MNSDFEKQIDELRQKVIEETMRNGGTTGSNMAEQPWCPPGPATIPDGLPPEEVAARKQRLADLEKGLDEYIAHVNAAKI